ncbi:proteasome subunit beta type-6 [Drosophila suzukii]|uniref:Proteasome subunit beta n=1 Tax=Drosophila suzukii TaxID=28584 RepID=A0AB39Z5R5_DROSZ|nr:proteasome subunit beta type-6 [Drosophila suzukii]XP_037715770.1 proteasome subunit beta type-6 [Drosophila subpulchrella]
MLPDFDFTDTPVSTGTTIMAVEFDGGVVIGADSRTSSGAYVANRVTDKLTRITDKVYCCRSGSAADTQAIADIVAYSLNYHENQTNKEALVFEAASEFRNYCYSYRESLLAGIIVAGWDAQRGGQVYSIPLGGMLTRESCTIGGSGSSFIYGFVREHYRPNMQLEECVAFVKKAVQHAIYHDGSSGGVVRIGIITKDGIERRIFYNTESGASAVSSTPSFASSA